MAQRGLLETYGGERRGHRELQIVRANNNTTIAHKHFRFVIRTFRQLTMDSLLYKHLKFMAPNPGM